MKRINEGSNRPKTQDGNYQKHRGGPEKRRMSKLRRQEGKQEKGENKEDIHFINQLEGMKNDAREEIFEASNYEKKYGDRILQKLAKRKGKLVTKLQWDKADKDQKADWLGKLPYSNPEEVARYIDVRWDALPSVIQTNMFESTEELEEERSFYPESFDNAVNDILKGLQEDVIEEAIPAIVKVVAKKAGPPIAAHITKNVLDRFLDGEEEESYCEDEEDGPSKMQRLQNYIDDKYPTLRSADTFIEDGIDTPAKLEYYLATADYSDTHKDYWGFRPRGFRDRLEENQWDDEDFEKAAKRLNDEADEYREKLRLQSPEYKAKKERELKQKHQYDPSDGGTSLRDVFSSFSKEENEG
jgi:hypothetical protein